MELPSGIRTVGVANWLTAIVAMLFAIYFAQTLIAPLVVAFLVYLTLRPVVGHVHRYRIPAPVAATGLLLLFSITLALSVATVIRPARQWARNLPDQIAQLRKEISSVKGPFDELRRASKEVEAIGDDQAQETDEPVEVEVIQPQWTSRYLVDGTSNVLGFAIAVVVLAFFLLATGDSLINRALHVMPSFSQRRRAVQLIIDLQSAVSRYLAQVTLINAGLGVAVTITMYFLDMPTPLLWGTMAMLLNYIPFLGALIGAAVIFLTAVVAFEPFSSAIIVTAAYLTLTTIEGQFITPTLLGRSLQLSPFFVILAVVFWGWMWGVVGIFVAVPLLIVIRMACEHFEFARPVAVILGGDLEAIEFGKSESAEDESQQDEPSEADESADSIPQQGAPPSQAGAEAAEQQMLSPGHTPLF